MIVFFYRNFKEYSNNYDNNSHVGLGINCLNIVKVLKKNGIDSSLYPIWKLEDIRRVLKSNGLINGNIIVIEAIFLSTKEVTQLLLEFPRNKFIVRCHSQIGFLVVEPGSIKLLREYLVLQEEQLNFQVAANNNLLSKYLNRTYGTSEVKYLPNLYYLDNNKYYYMPTLKGTLRIGSFGSLRILKNHITAASAAQIISRKLGLDLEFWISVNRNDGSSGYKNILVAIRNLFNGLKWARLVENGWEDWANFKQTIGMMNLCIQISHTETFNLVTADAISQGVPSVVGPAIEWVPDYWKVNPDNAEEVSRVGIGLLNDPYSIQDGIEKLIHYNDDGVEIWKRLIVN